MAPPSLTPNYLSPLLCANLSSAMVVCPLDLSTSSASIFSLTNMLYPEIDECASNIDSEAQDKSTKVSIYLDLFLENEIIQLLAWISFVKNIKAIA